MMNKQQLVLNKVAEHVTDKFNIGDDFMLTNFKAKDKSITLTSTDYEVTVKVTGQASHNLDYEINEELEALENSEIEDEDCVEDYLKDELSDIEDTEEWLNAVRPE